MRRELGSGGDVTVAEGGQLSEGVSVHRMANYDWLAVDFGTSHTVAVLRAANGHARQLLFDGTPLLPSAVYAQLDGRLAVGADALHLSREDPARFEPNPKRRIDEGSLLLGDREYQVVDLIAAVLHRVAAEAVRVAGGETPPPTVLTYPVDWGSVRRGVLLEAARRAGINVLTAVAEPVAAASFYTSVLGHAVTVGQALAVVDFGGGTLDIAVLRRTPEGFAVAGAGGANDLGGLDLDAAIIAQLRAGGMDWARLEQPATVADRRDRATLWADVRTAKEILSRQTLASVQLPGAVAATHLTRPEFEQLAGPAMDRTVRLTAQVLAQAGVGRPGGLVGLFLVGGSSRIPLLAQRLHQALGIAPTVLEQPEVAVAEGALRHASTLTPAVAAALDRMAASPSDPSQTVSASAEPPEGSSRGQRRSFRSMAIAGSTAVLIIAATGALFLSSRGSETGGGGSPTPSATLSPALRFLQRPPGELAGDAELKEFLQRWDNETWQLGCRQADDPDHRPNGHNHNTVAGAVIAEPIDVVHCSTGDYEVLFARYDGGAAERIKNAYTLPAGITPVVSSLLTDDDPPLYQLPRWSGNQRALMWQEGQFVVWLLTSRPETDLVLTWTTNRPSD